MQPWLNNRLAYVGTADILQADPSNVICKRTWTETIVDLNAHLSQPLIVG